MTPEQIREAFANCKSWACVVRRLGMPVGGASYKRVKVLAEQHRIDVSHFRGQAWSAGLTADDPRVAKRGKR
jgi:hypothetical protein